MGTVDVAWERLRASERCAGVVADAQPWRHRTVEVLTDRHAWWAQPPRIFGGSCISMPSGPTSLDRGTRQRDALALSEELSKMAVVATRIGRARERDHPRGHRGIQPVCRGAAGVAMHEPPQAVRKKARAQAPDRARREPENQCRLRDVDLVR